MATTQGDVVAAGGECVNVIPRGYTDGHVRVRAPDAIVLYPLAEAELHNTWRRAPLGAKVRQPATARLWRQSEEGLKQVLARWDREVTQPMREERHVFLDTITTSISENPRRQTRRP